MSVRSCPDSSEPDRSVTRPSVSGFPLGNRTDSGHRTPDQPAVHPVTAQMPAQMPAQVRTNAARTQYPYYVEGYMCALSGICAAAGVTANRNETHAPNRGYLFPARSTGRTPAGAAEVPTRCSVSGSRVERLTRVRGGAGNEDTRPATSPDFGVRCRGGRPALCCCYGRPGTAATSGSELPESAERRKNLQRRRFFPASSGRVDAPPRFSPSASTPSKCLPKCHATAEKQRSLINQEETRR